MSTQVINTGRDHRTALFIDGNSPSKTDFSERAKRLLQSLNGDNIKTDVFVVGNGGGTVAHRVSNSPVDLDLASSSAEAFDTEGLQAWASDAGYTQVLFSVPA